MQFPVTLPQLQIPGVSRVAYNPPLPHELITSPGYSDCPTGGHDPSRAGKTLTGWLRQGPLHQYTWPWCCWWWARATSQGLKVKLRVGRIKSRDIIQKLHPNDMVWALNLAMNEPSITHKHFHHMRQWLPLFSVIQTILLLVSCKLCYGYFGRKQSNH